VEREAERLERVGIHAIVTESSSRLSRYALGRRSERSSTLYVREQLPGGRTTRVQTLSEASSVFERYAGAHSIGRVYVSPEDRPAARAALADLL
jgi:hypothetical protein